jgi:hypothetical protein
VSVRPSLLEQLRGLIERTYGIDSGLADLGRFVVGNAGYRRFYAGREAATSVDSMPDTARTLVRVTTGALRACIYYPDELIETLERHPPQCGLSDLNVDAFATLVEELDHLLLLVWRERQRRPVSLFELELQANVTKHLVLSRYLAAGSDRLDDAERAWLRHHLFDKHEFEGVPEVAERYREAARQGVRFLDRLPAAPRPRLAALRRFHDVDVGGKLELIEALRRAG